MKSHRQSFWWAQALSIVAISTIFLAATAAIGAESRATGPQAEVADGIAARVNGDVITFTQVRELVAPRERALRSTLTGQALIDKVKEARLGALNDLIDRQLILQEFRKKDFNIPERIINERMDAIIREEFGGDRQAFVRTLQAQGYTMAKFREAERDKVIVQAMRYQNVKSEFIVSPNKMEKAYSASKEQYTTPEKVHLWMIAINKTSGLPAKEQDPQKAFAEEVRKKLLEKNAKFDQLAAMYSTDSSRSSGGDWGMIDNKTLNENLTKVAFRLEPKRISPVIEQGDTYYILMVSEKVNAYTKPMSEVRGEIEKKLSTEERLRLQEEWIAGLRKKAFIKIN